MNIRMWFENILIFFSNKYVFGITVFLLSTLTSAFISYYFSWKQNYNQRREQIFEEVSVLIESQNIILNDLDLSFGDDQPPEHRLDMWQRFEELQREYYGNKSRRTFLVDKYFGHDIASAVEGILSEYDRERNVKYESEKTKSFGRGFVQYYEIWAGISVDPEDENLGYKWKMMKLCGMDIDPYIREIKKNNNVSNDTQ